MPHSVHKLVKQGGVGGDCGGGGRSGGHPKVNVLGGRREPGDVFRGDGQVAVAGQVPQEAISNRGHVPEFLLRREESWSQDEDRLCHCY